MRGQAQRDTALFADDNERSEAADAAGSPAGPRCACPLAEKRCRASLAPARSSDRVGTLQGRTLHAIPRRKAGLKGRNIIAQGKGADRRPPPWVATPSVALGAAALLPPVGQTESVATDPRRLSENAASRSQAGGA